MTEVPRRSYPLVVPPPGGFEDAVRRGRWRRRRKAGGSTGAALALVGVLAFSSMNDPDGTRGLQVTNDPVPTSSPTYGAAPTGSPTAEPSATAGAPVEPSGSPTATAGPVTGGGPVVTAPPRETTPSATRPPRDNRPGRPYAARSDVDESEQFVGSTGCLPSTGVVWCASARAVKENDPETGGVRYLLGYTLCRSVDAGPGAVDFERFDEADYAVTNIANNDTVWTYSRGRPVRAAESTTIVDAGQCVEWSTFWDANDDYGLNPGPGQYRLTARSTGWSGGALPTRSYEFTVG